MPFDGTNTKGAKAVYVIDRMLEEFADGKRWTCGHYHETEDGVRKHCLIGAYNIIKKEMPYSYAPVYMRKAIEEWEKPEPCCSAKNVIINFNDNHIRTYKTIKHMLLRARELAQNDI